MNGNAVMFEDLIAWYDGNDPAAMEEGVDCGCHNAEFRIMMKIETRAFYSLILLSIGYFVDFYDLTIMSVGYNALFRDQFHMTDVVDIHRLYFIFISIQTAV